VATASYSYVVGVVGGKVIELGVVAGNVKPCAEAGVVVSATGVVAGKVSVDVPDPVNVSVPGVVGVNAIGGSGVLVLPSRRVSATTDPASVAM
jgi:hypothetical protein